MRSSPLLLRSVLLLVVPPVPGNVQAMDQYRADNGWRRVETPTELINVTDPCDTRVEALFISGRVGSNNLKIACGKITFIVGTNDTGTSTPGKLMTLPYHPEDGTIHFDDSPVDKAALEAYRQRISAVFSDDYLFDCVPQPDSAATTPVPIL